MKRTFAGAKIVTPVVLTLLTLVGCGKTAAPPPGAPVETNAPEIELGNDSPTQETATPETPPPADVPSAEKQL